MADSVADSSDPFTSVLVGFAHELRVAGLTIGTGDVLAYFAAMTPLDPTDLIDLYWGGRAPLVSRHEDDSVYDQVFRRYFLDDRSKKDIAEEFGLSRFRVARILDRARETGLVHIEIRLPAAVDPDLSDRLRRAFGLHHAIVVITPEESAALHRDHLGEIGARLLTEIVIEGDVLGISWGRTLNSMTAALESLARCTVVQLTGAIGSADVLQNSIEMVRRVAAVTRETRNGE